MRDEERQSIRSLPLFATMAQACFDRLTPASFLQKFPAGVTIVREGDPSDFLHVVLEGAVELFAESNNRETAISIVRPIATFILAAAVRDVPQLMSGRTLTPSRILMIPSRNIRTCIAEDQAFAQAMIDELAGSFRFMVKTVKNQKLRTAIERLANYLLACRHKEASLSFTLPIEKQLLASLLGMTPESLSRAFGTLKAYGVEVDGNKVVLSNEKDLTTLAKPSPFIDDPLI
ncbi:MAG: cyclic nucleotide-binding domain-containing protein [Alphaproteobacteria bacterium]|nr:cyclic nucleotide-binding domain-containing protein [Alphaproteobacteria bacterium]